MLYDLLKKAQNRNPDAFDMYIYNDYYPYAIHNLIESSFAVIKSKVSKKEWKEAFYAIEALTVFFEFESVWTTCDDGDLTQATNKLYGALLLEILKGLQSNEQLSSEVFPNLENVLHTAFTFGENMKDISCKSEYTTYCKAVANKLFKGTTAANRALYEARLREHAESIEDAEEKSSILEDIDEYVKGVKSEKTVWYMKGKIGKDEIKTTGLARAWSEYKGNAPTVPFKGPPEWDLTRWSEEDKKPFSFDSMDDEFM
ncbi:hypothetical protein AN958_05683 [Leucoagaricus sp. SymC.cos]|nr:hypothetical protein AN958_05683 [Leucoagaricus sp. SymC.cos]